MTSTQIIRILSILTVALVLAACGDSSQDGDAAASGSSGDAASASAAASQSVTIDDLEYSPAKADVATGTTVTWTNDDDVPHTVTFDDDAVTDSGQLEQGDEFSTTFNQAGEFSYICAIHPDMKGTVTVR